MGTNLPIPYSDAVETIPPDESDDIQRIKESLQQLLARTRAASGEYRRDVHVKSHGCALAEFRVLPNLSDDLSQGLFAQEATFPAIVRFSNSAPQRQPDVVPDGRGLSIQVQAVKGEFLPDSHGSHATQDFLMVNHPVFIASTVKDYLKLEQVRLTSTIEAAATLGEALTGGHWNPLSWHWREVLAATSIASSFPVHPASSTYFSMVPIRFGKYVAKYRVRLSPDCTEPSLKLTSTVSNADAMRLALEETFRSRDAIFDFQVQLRTSEKTMPVEDAAAEWPETESPYRSVAQLIIRRQDPMSSELQTACENLSFNVWHALAAHRPLGGINRVRRVAYAVSYAWRSEHTQEPVKEVF